LHIIFVDITVLIISEFEEIAALGVNIFSFTK
jgi:hypothetical protein